MRRGEYDRERAVAYAHRWAFGRNPAYFNFDNIGGDCTNFISQIIFSGSKVMNTRRDTGWYYRSLSDRSPSWTGVEFLHRFLTQNDGIGPVGADVRISDVTPGDIVQLSFDGLRFAHSLCVVDIKGPPAPENLLIATHTFDSDYRPLDTYLYQAARFIHITHVNLW